ncbi:uncharacterized protein [Palaemon carinicauda]|uniref:uncharacterized protein isoform X1 n=1 Tax=Palaemon carinicauda TaxID=392227 RepID=UPI0035B651ED
MANSRPPIEWSRSITLRFIELLKDHPSVWNIKCKQFKNKKIKSASLETIKSGLSSLVNCTLHNDDLTKKLHTLKTQFHREMSAIKASQKSGTHTEDSYIPKLWCFKELSFMSENGESRATTSTLDEGETTNNTQDDSISEGKEDLSRLSNREGSPEERTSDHTNETIPAPKRHKLNVKNCHPHPSQQQPHHTRQESPTFQPATEDRQPVTEVRQPVTEVRQPATEVKDDISYFADYVGSELRTVTDRRALALAKHNINTILFEATTGLYNKKNGRG